MIGLDSSEEGQWFAQGAVNDASITRACRIAVGNSYRDLVIVLVHHHVLPIPNVEKNRAKQGLIAVADVTGLLNSGILLNGLSESHVNLVLHGTLPLWHLSILRGGGAGSWFRDRRRDRREVGPEPRAL